jgi:hypothetical protein
MRTYVYNVLRGLDVFVNTLLGGRVRTISARIGDKKVSGTMGPFTAAIDWVLDKIDPGHSETSYRAWQAFTARSGKEYILTERDPQ